jgi:hypothetical protein
LIENESATNLLHAILDVKSFAKMKFGVEEDRPARCWRCGIGAGHVGSLRIHGHGLRERHVWGPPETMKAAAQVLALVLRRYRCLECRHVMTVRPPFLARYFRYTTAAIALAMWLWAIAEASASTTRERISPWPRRGLSEPHRWRSLGRWLGRLGDLFGLHEELGEVGRSLAARGAHLVMARAPPELPHPVRAFVGAQLR